MKTKLNSDDDLSLGKILNLHNITIVIRSAFWQVLSTSFFRWMSVWSMDIVSTINIMTEYIQSI